MSDNANTCKKAYALFREKSNRLRKTEAERIYLTYSCIAHIGGNISKKIGNLLSNSVTGEKTLTFVKQVSKELCLRSVAYHPPASAFKIFTNNRVSGKKKEAKLNIRPEVKISSVAGNRLQVYGVICQEIIHGYNELLEFPRKY
uniref:Uncharacterized protein n=1 Tax=Strongyloides papillosus TaxID=174720 RepID=A0A0N5BBJ2_STREA